MRAGAALVLLLGLLVSACGGGGLPDLGPCPEPEEPSPTPEGAGPEFLYVTTVLDGVADIDARARAFHREWPDRELDDSDRFRDAFNEYAHAAVCQSQALAAATPFGEAQDFDATFEAALSRYVDVMEDGRDAVRQRNVSEFRRWDDREASAVANITALPGELLAMLDELDER